MVLVVGLFCQLLFLKDEFSVSTSHNEQEVQKEVLKSESVQFRDNS